MTHQTIRQSRELLNQCALAGAIGCINDELGRRVRIALAPILSDGVTELEGLAKSYTFPNQVNRHFLAQAAVSDFVAWVLARSSIGGCSPDEGNPKAYFYAGLRYSLYAEARTQRRSALPTLDSDVLLMPAPCIEGLCTPAEVKAAARQVLATLPAAYRIIILCVYPFLDEDGAAAPARPKPTPPALPGYARSRALRMFFHRVQAQLGLPRTTIGQAKRRGRRRRHRRRAKTRSEAADIPEAVI